MAAKKRFWMMGRSRSVWACVKQSHQKPYQHQSQVASIAAFHMASTAIARWQPRVRRVVALVQSTALSGSHTRRIGLCRQRCSLLQLCQLLHPQPLPPHTNGASRHSYCSSPAVHLAWSANGAKKRKTKNAKRGGAAAKTQKRSAQEEFEVGVTLACRVCRVSPAHATTTTPTTTRRHCVE